MLRDKVERWIDRVKYNFYSRDDLIKDVARLCKLEKQCNALIIENECLLKQNKKLEKKNQTLRKLLKDLNGIKVSEVKGA